MGADLQIPERFIKPVEEWRVELHNGITHVGQYRLQLDERLGLLFKKSYASCTCDQLQINHFTYYYHVFFQSFNPTLAAGALD